MSSSSLTSGNFALQIALLSAIKACGASCGAVISFWDPNGATLSSVEFMESNSAKFQHTTVTAPSKTNNNAEIFFSSFESASKISDAPSAIPMLPHQMTSNINKDEIHDESTLSQPQQHQINANSSNDQSQTILPTPQVISDKEANNNNNNSSFLPSKIPATSLGSPTTRIFSYSYRCVAIASTATAAASASPQNPKNNFSNSRTAKYNHLAHVFSGDDGETDKGKNLNHQLHHHRHRQESQIQFYNTAHSILANRAITPAVVQAVAKSGMSVHCTSPSSPYLAIPVMARKSQIDLIYSASSKRLLEDAGPAGSLNHLVVVGILMLVGFPVVDENAVANSLAILEGGGGGGGRGVNDRQASLNCENASNLSKREVRMMLNSQASTASEKENAFNVLSSKKVSFRAEEETVAVTLARTVFAEILSTPEGMLSVEKSVGNYLANSVSMLLQRPPDNSGNITKNSGSSSSPKALKSSSTFRTLAGAAKLVAKLGAVSSNMDNSKNNNNNNNNSTSNNQVITEIDDFHRSTIQRRIPQIIRIPDTTIFLSHRGILSQKTDEFQALPDLPEVKKTIEEAEQALAMLREQNMSLQNIMNTTTTSATTSSYSHNGGNETNEGGIPSFLPSSSSSPAATIANARMMTVQEGMEKLEKKIAALRRENISLRNHVELLTHRLDSVTSRKSIQSVAMSQMLGALDDELTMMGAISTNGSKKLSYNEDDDDEDADDQDKNNYRPHSRENDSARPYSSSGGGLLRNATWGDTLLMAARNNDNSSKHGNRPPSSTHYYQSSNIIAPRPPTSASSTSVINNSRSYSTRDKNTDDNNNNNNNFIFKAAHDVLSRSLPPSVLLEAKAVEGLDKLKMELANKGGGAMLRGNSAQPKNWRK